PQGIAEFTLFNSELKPLAERLVYVNPQKQLHINTTLDKTEYKTREKVNLSIKVTDENGLPVIAHLGLSVFDKLYENNQDSKNILTHYMLSSQLKGNIYNPEYYFDENIPLRHRQEALNLLMLTQGWRRYIWNIENLKESHQNAKPF
ncbi:hypothetical protein ICJ85_16155, partial [Aestuariibaculum marinum]|nr:hypothetical protein [Aestuariibaculum marinum]